MTKIRYNAKAAKPPVAMRLNGALSNSNFLYNKQLRCANIESSAEWI